VDREGGAVPLYTTCLWIVFSVLDLQTGGVKWVSTIIRHTTFSIVHRQQTTNEHC
jgi:hypothetical protein